MATARIRGWWRGVLSTRVAAAVIWILMATQSLYADALAEQESGFRTTVSVFLWLMFAAVLVVIVSPGSIPLTAARIVVPANVASSVWAFAVVDDRSWADHGTALAIAVAAAVAVLAPVFGDVLIDAGSYGDERRFLLRPPGPIVVSLLVPTWAVAVAGAASGPLLLADRRWAVGGASLAVGLPLSFLAARALHRLARRWLVFVPAGLVVHDHLTMTEPVLFSRREIVRIGPALAHTTATDATAHAFGLALEIELGATVVIPLVIRRGRSDDTTVQSLLVAPSRPAAVMAAAASRNISVG